MRTKRPARAVSEFRYSPLVAAVAVALAPQAVQATTKTVNNTSDASFAGTLREALEFFAIPANCTGSDRIEFQANGAFTTNVSTPLPIITCGGLTIDGVIQPAANDLAHVQAFFSYGGLNDALNAQTASPVLVQNLQVEGFIYGTALAGNIASKGNVIRNNFVGYEPRGYNNLQVSDGLFQNNTHGITLSGATGITINNNQVTDSISRGINVLSSDNINITGNTVSANRTGIYVSYGGSAVTISNNAITNNSDVEIGPFTGVYLEGARATVDNNHISANDYSVYLASDDGSKITSNRIGTSADGVGSMGNSQSGIVFGGTGFSSISRDTLISGNVISANGGYGIDLSDFSNVTISGNLIGTSLDGTVGMGNRNGGIIAYCGSGIVVSGNVISGNGGSAIEFGAVQGGGALNIVGNKIGVQGNGITPLGNSSYGVSLFNSSCGLVQDKLAKAKGKGLKAVIGGTNDLRIIGNTIANNSTDGVLVSSGTGNKIVENRIYDNGGKNINLGAPGGPRANDAGDADGGPNNGQNYPVITSVNRDWPNARTIVAFTLDTVPGTYRIDVYSGSNGTPGGRVHEASVTFSAGAGPTSGSIDVPNLSTGNQTNSFTLTATTPSDGGVAASASGDTSEFSPAFSISTFSAVTVIPNPPTLNFGQVPVDSTSAPQTITLLSSGNAPYRISRMGLNSCTGGSFYGGPFMIANACVSNRDYAPGESCQFTARFAPIALGPQNMTVGVCDNATFQYGGQSFFLTGTGGEPPPVTIAPSEYDFGEVLSGTSSPTQTFQIHNPGASDIAIGPVTVSNGEFVIDSTTCRSSLAANGFCEADVAFRPTQPGSNTGILSVTGTSSAPPSDHGPTVKIRRMKAASGSATSTLYGQSINKADITLPPFIDFGAYTIGTPALRQTVVIQNVGNAVVSFNNISVTGPFVLGNGCPLNIQPGERCTLTLDFSATTVGSFTGALSVVSNAAGGTRTIPITARSVAIPTAQLQVTPNSLSFGERLLGTVSATQRVTIKNVGNIPASISSITSSADFVVLGNTCTLPLAPSSSCFADVALRPAGFGPRGGSLFVNSDVTGSPNVVGLGGTGCRPFSSSASRFGMGSGFNCAP